MAIESSSFTGADENPLVENNGTNDRWRTGDGFSGLVQRSGNTARAAVANQDDYATLNPARLTVSDNQYSQIRLAAYTSQSLGVLVRIKSSTDSDCYGLYTAVTVYKLYKQVDSGASISSVQLGANFGTPAVNAILKLTVNGTNLKAYIDNVQLENQYDSSYISGQPGFGFYTDNVNTNYFDDWEGGDLFSAGNFDITLKNQGTAFNINFAGGPSAGLMTRTLTGAGV